MALWTTLNHSRNHVRNITLACVQSATVDVVKRCSIDPFGQVFVAHFVLLSIRFLTHPNAAPLTHIMQSQGMRLTSVLC